jgi:phospholipid/cholesterol/gamma-HCH transport system substrate-binding protein
MKGRARRAPAALVTMAALAMAASSLSGCALSLQSLPKVSSNNAPTYTVHAVFGNVLNLPSDAQVREGAAVVGEVKSIAAKNFQADLTLAIDKTARLPIGTTAEVRFDNPLGDEYVLLQPPPAGASTKYLAAGSLIPASNTATAPSVEDTLGALSLVLNGGGLNQLQTIIHELNNTFNGNQPQIRSFLTTIDGGLKTIDSGKTSIDDALVAIERLSKSLSAGGKTIAGAISSLAPAIGVLSSENGQISQLLNGLSKLGTIGTQVAQESGANSVADVHDLLPVVTQLESVTSQLAPDLQILSAFEQKTPTVAPGDYLQVSAVVNVLLPAGAFEPGGPVGGTAASPAAPATGAQAVGYMLSAGLS